MYKTKFRILGACFSGVTKLSVKYTQHFDQNHDSNTNCNNSLNEWGSILRLISLRTLNTSKILSFAFETEKIKEKEKRKKQMVTQMKLG